MSVIFGVFTVGLLGGGEGVPGAFSGGGVRMRWVGRMSTSFVLLCVEGSPGPGPALDLGMPESTGRAHKQVHQMPEMPAPS